MAIWQYEFHIIPKSNMKLSNYDEAWLGIKLSNSSIQILEKFFPLTKSWSDNIKQYGDSDHTCIQLFYEKNNMISIRIRIDLYSITKEELNVIIDFICQNYAIIVTDTNVLVEPCLTTIIDLIKKSDQFSFVKNPQEFFTKLK